MFDTRHTNRRHWQIAQDFILTLFNLFGAPQEIAAEHTLLRDQWRLITKWLRAGETLMRQLLLLEAAALPKPNTRPLLWPRRTRKRREIGFSADAPEDWRVSFRCFSLSDRRLPAGKPALQPAQAGESRNTECRQEAGGPRERRFYSAWPLAERAEALLRVFNDPAPYAKRLAARLYATPHRARPMLHYAAELIPLIGEDDFWVSYDAALTASGAFDST
ncbi:hypothetical protein [Terricaulis silvestris]|uniref:Uncharacterized protein n=1 Tax=Terricaulis silvestris TaxID=2686094 RepID=A0A6I6MJZ1_9CAUL|nr:hypothetical protein [Terricaulis silvestris]QGZ93264.1 hypothetical protein DSM104635_00072 [Terricaulis silvestris]